jgi:hypothetical protein
MFKSDPNIWTPRSNHEKKTLIKSREKSDHEWTPKVNKEKKHHEQTLRTPRTSREEKQPKVNKELEH